MKCRQSESQTLVARFLLLDISPVRCPNQQQHRLLASRSLLTYRTVQFCFSQKSIGELRTHSHFLILPVVPPTVLYYILYTTPYSYSILQHRFFGTISKNETVTHLPVLMTKPCWFDGLIFLSFCCSESRRKPWAGSYEIRGSIIRTGTDVMGRDATSQM